MHLNFISLALSIKLMGVLDLNIAKKNFYFLFHFADMKVFYIYNPSRISANY